MIVKKLDHLLAVELNYSSFYGPFGRAFSVTFDLITAWACPGWKQTVVLQNSSGRTAAIV